MEVWWEDFEESLKILCLDRAESLSGHAAAPSHPITRTFFGCEGECEVALQQYVLQQCVSAEHSVNMCALARNTDSSTYEKKKSVAVSPRGAGLKLTQNRPCTRTPTYTCSFRKLESCVVVMETQVPRSYHLPTSQTLLYPSWHSAICSFGTERSRPDGGGSYQRWNKPGGSQMEAGHGGEQARAGYHRLNCHEMKRRRVFMWHLSPPLWFFGPPPSRDNVRATAVFPHHRLWSASSVPGGLTSIMHLGSQTHAHNTHREQGVQSGDSEVKSIVCAYVCVCSAHLGTLVLYWAFSAQHSSIHFVATCAGGSWVRPVARLEEFWPKWLFFLVPAMKHFWLLNMWRWV